MPPERFPRVEAASREELRAWLAANHRRTESVWLSTWKKAAGAKHIPYDAIVEEAICYRQPGLPPTAPSGDGR